MRLSVPALLLCAPTIAAAQGVPYQSITSVGPLTGIHLGNEASVQVAHVTDGLTHEFYPPDTLPGDGGTLLVVDGVLYAPNFALHNGSATGSIGAYTAFTPISQSMLMGLGTLQSPFSYETLVTTGTSGIQLRHTDSYVVGQESYRTDVELTNLSTSTRSLILYRAADCFLGGSDSGFGVTDALTGAVGCSQNANNSPPGRIEQWLPISPGSSFYQAGYDDVWTWIGTHQPFPDTCECAVQIDNGSGLSWVITLAPGATVTRSHLTTFSPVGTLPLSTLKAADSATVAVGAANGYTITVDNRNPFAVPITGITDTLPAGFSYVPGSTSGALTADPVNAGGTLTWTAALSVPGQGSLSIHFGVLVATSTGAYFNNASATAAAGVTVSPTGDTARVFVALTGGADGGATGVDGGGATGVDGGGATGVDGGATGVDGGTTGVDGGATGVDAGQSGEDAMSSNEDAASGDDDAMTTVDDAMAADDDAATNPTDDAATNPTDDAMATADDATTSPADDATTSPADDATTTAGRDAATSAAADATARVDTGIILGDDEGCSCNTGTPISGAPWALGILALAWARRRRRA